MGDPIITSATDFKTDVLELGAANGVRFSIAAGKYYCSEGMEFTANYHNPQAVALKISMGKSVTMLIMQVSYDAAKMRHHRQMALLILHCEISIKTCSR